MEAISHVAIPHCIPEAVTLHLAFDHIEWITNQPQYLPRQAAVTSDLPLTDLISPYSIPRRVRVHHPFKGTEPGSIRLSLAEQGHGLAPVQPTQHAGAGGNFTDAVQGAGVNAGMAMRLRLQPDSDVLNWAGKDAISNPGKGARKIILCVGERCGWLVVGRI
jgi:hypothetical protein